jgi:hypothetical protein
MWLSDRKYNKQNLHCFICWLLVVYAFIPLNTLPATALLPFQTLHTPKGFEILFLENRNASTITVHLGFKKSGVWYDRLKSNGFLSLFTSQILQNGLNDMRATLAKKLADIPH